jgi:ankyrin repeat protein
MTVHQLARRGDVDELRSRFAKEGAAFLTSGETGKPRAAGWSEECALHTAARHDQAEAVRVLVKELRLPVDGVDKWGRAAVHVAANYGSVEALRELKACGAALDLAQRNGWHAAHVAARANCVEGLEALHELGADIMAQDGNEGHTPLHTAVVHDSRGALLALLRMGACSPDAHNARGDCAAHLCAFHGRVQLLCDLATAGADLLAVDARGNTPAHCGASLDQVPVLDACVELLLARFRDASALLLAEESSAATRASPQSGRGSPTHDFKHWAGADDRPESAASQRSQAEGKQAEGKHGHGSRPHTPSDGHHHGSRPHTPSGGQEKHHRHHHHGSRPHTPADAKSEHASRPHTPAISAAGGGGTAEAPAPERQAKAVGSVVGALTQPKGSALTIGQRMRRASFVDTMADTGEVSDARGRRGGSGKAKTLHIEYGGILDTLPHAAAFSGALTSIKWLHGMGFPMCSRDSAGATPMHKAAHANNVAVIEYLYEHGGKEALVVRDSDGETPAQLARRMQSNGAYLRLNEIEVAQKEAEDKKRKEERAEAYGKHAEEVGSLTKEGENSVS